MNRVEWRVSYVGAALLVLTLALLLFAMVFPWMLLILPFFILPPPEKRLSFESYRNKTPHPFFPARVRGRAPPL
jgi:hypothetical protein